MNFRPLAVPFPRPLNCLFLAALHSFPALSAELVVIDCHVPLWTLSRPAGIGWIKKDDPVLYRDFLPADHEAVAKANGVDGVVLVQAGQSLLDNPWNLDVSAHNPKLCRGVAGNLSEVIESNGFKPLFTQLWKDPRYLGFRLSGRYQEDLSEAFYRDLGLSAEAGKSVDFLIGGYSLKEVDAIARRVPNFRIILDHFGNIRLDGNPLDPAWVEVSARWPSTRMLPARCRHCLVALKNSPRPRTSLFTGPSSTWLSNVSARTD